MNNSISSPNQTQLSDLIADTNRLIAEENERANIQKREIVPSTSKRSAPQGSPEESPKNRISAKYSSNTSSSVLSENNGITTTVIRSSTTPPAAGISSGSGSNDTSRPAHVLDNIPHADNRIFLGQKG